MIILIVSLFGVICFFRLGLDLLPELEYPVCSVVTTYEGVASEEIETLITQPIEEMVSTVQRVKRVTSTSQEGVSAVVVEFEWGTNLDFAAQDIREKISWITDLLPEDADSPTVIKLNLSDFPILIYGVTGLQNTQVLREYLQENVRPKLEKLDGVASAPVLGGLEREIQILLRPERMEAVGISVDDVIKALRSENLNISGGHLVRGEREYLIRTMGEFKDMGTIENTVVHVLNGVPVRIRDVATVMDSHREVRNYCRSNGRDSVLLLIMKQSGANTVQVVDRVKAEIEKIKPLLPPDINFYPVYDTGGEIKKVVKRSASNAIVGGGLAVLLILLFLRNWRPTFTISMAIPLSILTTFIGIYLMGYTFNIMTLGGMALGVGMLVDNAVVVIENIFRHIQRGTERKKAAVVGASEVGMAITASTLTTMAVFLPMAMSGGISGKLSQPLALTVCVALASSLFVAITLVPMLASVIFRDVPRGIVGSAEPMGRITRYHALYRATLQWALRHRAAVLLPALGLFALSLLVIATRLGFDFMPKQDTSLLMAVVRLPAGTSLEETNETLKKMERLAHQAPETLYSSTFIGLQKATKQDVAFGFGAAGVNEAQFMLRLKDKAKRKRTSHEVVEDIRSRLPKLPGAVFEFLDVGQMMMGGLGQTPIEINIFGKDLDTLRRLGNRVTELVREVPGLRDVRAALEVGKPEIRIHVDREKASQMGLSVGTIAMTLKAALQGRLAGTYRVGGDEYDIRVRFVEEKRDTLEDIREVPIFSPLGFSVPLYHVASISYERGPVKIFREDQQRKNVITANTFGRDLGGVVEDIKKRVSTIKLPAGYFLEYAGTYEDMKESQRELLWALMVAVLLIYMVMAAQFESLRQPFIIMFTLPLATIGAVLGLWAFGRTMSVPSLMGIIILGGIVVNNAIVMVDYVNQLRRKGMDGWTALVEGAVVRLRPILITALTTILGMLPMALSRSEGAELRSPMGITVSCGLFVATFLTLYVVPILYATFSGISMRSGSSRQR
jgi:HAE1 family hydrophobic/amphiphilic exporter-1